MSNIEAKKSELLFKLATTVDKFMDIILSNKNKAVLEEIEKREPLATSFEDLVSSLSLIHTEFPTPESITHIGQAAEKTKE